jgi:hypothetical protein
LIASAKAVRVLAEGVMLKETPSKRVFADGIGIAAETDHLDAVIAGQRAGRDVGLDDGTVGHGGRENIRNAGVLKRRKRILKRAEYLVESGEGRLLSRKRVLLVVELSKRKRGKGDGA